MTTYGTYFPGTGDVNVGRPTLSEPPSLADGKLHTSQAVFAHDFVFLRSCARFAEKLYVVVSLKQLRDLGAAMML
jgi:hypothetical protein